MEKQNKPSALTGLFLVVLGSIIVGCGLGLVIFARGYLEVLYGVGSLSSQTGFLYGWIALFFGLVPCVIGIYRVKKSL